MAAARGAGAAGVWLVLAGWTLLAAGSQIDAPAAAARLAVPGGLAVQLGGGFEPSAALVRTGRFIAHLLYRDEQAAAGARRELRERGLYGPAVVETWDGRRLPFTENLVNLVVAAEAGAAAPLGEAHRVLCPGGVLLARRGTYDERALLIAGFALLDGAPDGWMAAGKRRPEAMDAWTHPRHGADGNPVSQDALVGPPRRVRWVAAADVETPDVVISERRSIYGAALARDSFNGLRVWARDLARDSQGRFQLRRLSANEAAPVVAGRWLLAVDHGRLAALDEDTGQPRVRYETAEQPLAVLHDEGLVIAAGRSVVEAFELRSGRRLWRRAAAEPRSVVAGGQVVAYLEGQARRGEAVRLAVLEKRTGRPVWSRDDLPWLPKASRLVYHDGLLACEVSSWNDDGPGNSLHLLRADSGEVVWDREFLPGMNHKRQARAMFVGDQLWVLEGGKDEQRNPRPLQSVALDLYTGEPLRAYPAGLAHCFPPVATSRFMLAGEMNFTDLFSGRMVANHITKAACGPDHGWVPANGLVYVTPKHCTCWPMLRGFAALAPQRPGGDVGDVALGQLQFPLVRGDAPPPAEGEPANDEPDAWPCYRHDAARSGATGAAGPDAADQLWAVNLAPAWPSGPIADDWAENPYVKGPVTAPVVAGGTLVVARSDAHEVVALDAATGRQRWRFVAEGRVDTPPTLHRGLCLFGSKYGWVYCLRADDGRLVWKRRCAPLEERITAYGQVESPWPSPGSVLVSDGVAYFAAGRQPLADGGVFVFAADPASGRIRWIHRLDTVPQQGFYENSALEFDNFDLLHRQADGVAMSRWIFDPATGDVQVDKWRAFARFDTAGGAVIAYPGCWSYAPRHQRRIPSYTPRRPLLVFRGDRLYGCLQGAKTIYRRDFDLDGGETFNMKWMTGWEAARRSREGEMPWRSYRLAEKAKWKLDVYGEQDQQTIAAMALAGDRLWLVGSQGDLRIHDANDGRLIARRQVPPPLWDGLAFAYGRAYLTTADGRVLCLGAKAGESSTSGGGI